MSRVVPLNEKNKKYFREKINLLFYKTKASSDGGASSHSNTSLSPMPFLSLPLPQLSSALCLYFLWEPNEKKSSFETQS